MSVDPILDHFEKEKPNPIQENVKYRSLLVILWLLGGLVFLNEGRRMVDRMLAPNASLFDYDITRMAIYFILGCLALGMAFVIYQQLEDRISYLFSFVGILLLTIPCTGISEAWPITCLPIILLAFARDLRTGLECYGVIIGFSFVVLGGSFMLFEQLFMDYAFLVIYVLVFMSGYNYRKILFPLRDVNLDLRFRLALFVGWIPFLVGVVF
ncbi:MAG: Unknown protein [uncultured Aureispira sp.]|uniref:Uncharacterized protein n=1 Tax=uncultured Aureispira sp. TaxID=1331704 RepID=A0A6S6UBF6_9BACT|nr:MAG: Unknown protein [uncultured Aureispira sp.]